MGRLTHFSLFSGVGGIDLAAEWAGFTSVGQCEFADYPTKVLQKHWPDVPRWRDVRDVTADSFREKTGLQTVDLISGGFPCQPFSVAGQRRGKEDDRYLWPEMLRVIKELRPRWVLGENVAGFISLGLDNALSDLEACGYEAWAVVLPACAVGAPHRRDRVFIVANSGCTLRQGAIIEKEDKNEARKGNANINQRPGAPPGTNVSNPNGERLQAGRCKKSAGWAVPCRYSKRRPLRATEPGMGGMVDGIPSELDGYWDIEPGIPRVATGINKRADRLKCLGNAVVPQQVYPILQGIAEIERRLNRHG